jgi:hypothetical protein
VSRNPYVPIRLHRDGVMRREPTDAPALLAHLRIVHARYRAEYRVLRARHAALRAASRWLEAEDALCDVSYCERALGELPAVLEDLAAHGWIIDPSLPWLHGRRVRRLASRPEAAPSSG